MRAGRGRGKTRCSTRLVIVTRNCGHAHARCSSDPVGSSKAVDQNPSILDPKPSTGGLSDVDLTELAARKPMTWALTQENSRCAPLDGYQGLHVEKFLSSASYPFFLIATLSLRSMRDNSFTHTHTRTHTHTHSHARTHARAHTHRLKGD